MYRRFAHIFRRPFLRVIPMAVCALALSSCLKDDLSDCPMGGGEFTLYVKIVDIETGRDITSDGETEEVILAMFDRHGRFVTTYILDREAISSRRGIVLAEEDASGMQVSAWGDIGTVMERRQTDGSLLGGDFLTLPVDDKGYSPSPDDFFFGLDRIIDADIDYGRKEIVVTQKNSKLHITARGLPDRDPDNYYYVVETASNGYDFGGEPLANASKVRRDGEFRGNDFVSPEPYLMIHSAETDNPAAPEQGAVVRLYRRGTSDDPDTEIATAVRDTLGREITLYPGKTTNVLIDILSTGAISVRIEITPWRQVYQWSAW